MIKQFASIDELREDLLNLRRAKKAHCQALELLSQQERATMDTIREIEAGIQQQMTGAIMTAVTVNTACLN